MKILILTNNQKGQSIAKLKNEAEKRKHYVEILHPADLMAMISESDRGHDRIFLKSGPDAEVKRVLAKNYDVIIPRFAGSHIFEYGATILAHLSENLHIPSVASAKGLRVCSNKFLTHQNLSLSRVRTIKSMFCNRPSDFGFITDQLGIPLVAKTLIGSQGSGVFILNDELSISTALSAVSGMGVNLLLQRFIDSGKPASDLRIFIVDGVAVAGYRRVSLDSDFRANYSISKQGQPVEITAEISDLAVKAANAVGLSGCCGVDLIEDTTDNNRLFVVEVNGNASLSGIEKVTRVNIAAKIIDYAEKLAKVKKEREKKEEAELQNPDYEAQQVYETTKALRGF